MLEIRGFKTEVKKCAVCKKEMHEGLLAYVEKFGFVCTDCAKKQNNYSVQNSKAVRKPNKDGITFSIEFETCEKAPDCCLLYKYGFVPASDGSINGHEWKSPIFNSLVGAKKMFESIEPLSKYVDSSCGTHIHVGTLKNEVKKFIRRHEVTLFEPTFDRINEKKDETEKFWGRKPNNYSQVEFIEDRYQAYNTRGDRPTLEYRLAKFINAEQFYNVVKYSCETTNYLNKIASKLLIPEFQELSYPKQKRILKEHGMMVLDIYKKHVKNI